jgi:Domain of unknown function (DUF4276)
VIYLRAGVYAEGPTDYQFLCPLLDRHIEVLAARLFSGSYDIAATLGIDARVAKGTARAERIAAAVAEYADQCELFVIHSDGEGDPDGKRATCVEPGIAAARAALTDREIVTVGCVPVREIEAWLLTDRDAFQPLLGSAIDPGLPTDPEKDLDPKATLRKILESNGVRPGPELIYASFGDRVRIDALRALPAFRRFEADLVDAIEQVARSQGHRA